jgi:ankyrin repeat protein
MGAGASLTLSKEEVSSLTPEHFAQYAKDNHAHDVVFSTILKEDVDGCLVYELEDKDLTDWAQGAKYKYLTSALHKLKASDHGEKKYEGKKHPPFIQAAKDGNIHDVEILLNEKGMDVNQKNLYGQTALHLAAAAKHSKAIDVLKVLLSHDCLEINQQSKDLFTPLHFASGRGCTESVKLLLHDPRIRVNLVNRYGETPLLKASRKNHTEIMNMLKAKGGKTYEDSVWYHGEKTKKKGRRQRQYEHLGY